MEEKELIDYQYEHELSQWEEKEFYEHLTNGAEKAEMIRIFELTGTYPF